MNISSFQTTLKGALLSGLLAGLGSMSIQAQYTFNSGSDGSYGPLNIITNTTLPLPPDGIFRCTTIFIATNCTLKFTPNALNTPVYLLATNNVTINGTIDVSGTAGNSLVGGAGGPGGFGGGNPAAAGLLAGDGKGPGAGRCGFFSDPGGAGGACPGCGAYGSGVSANFASTNDGTTYGSVLLVPLVGGSGGGGVSVYAYGGSGGGGAILIACNTRIDISGSLLSVGATAVANYSSIRCGNGSGGAIRLVAPTIAGAGTVNVSGANGIPYPNPNWNYTAGSGRIRIDCLDRSAMALNCTAGVTSIGANMVAIPANAPRLDITQVAGTNITVGTSSSVFFMLPSGASTNQTVKVQASNFGTVVAIRVVLTPDNGSSTVYDTNIDNTVTTNSVTVPVVVPVNVQVQVSAWTR